jgi:hypothetical protein
LRARLDANGSLEYDLTWKHWDTPSGPPICALRASARRISVSVYIGWPIEGWPKTPMASDGDGGVMEIRPETTEKYKLRDYAQLAGWATATATKTTQSGELQNADGTPWDGSSKPYQNGKPVMTALGDQVKLAGWMTTRVSRGAYTRDQGDPDKPRLTLEGEVVLAGWPTATAVNRERDADTMAKCAAFRKRNANQDTVPLYLGEVAQFAAWPLTGFPTSRAIDGAKGQRTLSGVERERERKGGQPPDELPSVVMFAGWPTTNAVNTKGAYEDPALLLRQKSGHQQTLQDVAQTAIPGPISVLFLVPTGKRVVLAPEFSLWLMGFPEGWAAAAPGAKDWREAQAVLGSEFSKALETQSPLGSPPNS